MNRDVIHINEKSPISSWFAPAEFLVWRARAPQMTSPSYRLYVLAYPIRFDHYDNGLEYESLFSYDECINSKLQREIDGTLSCHTMMTMRNQRRPLGLLLLTVALLPFISFGKEDRNPTCEQVNSEYDDGVVCNEPDSTTDFSHDLSALDPNQAPKRCDDWNIQMMNLNEIDPLYVCIEWHRLYGVLKPATSAPTGMPTIVPTLSPSTCTGALVSRCDVKTLIAVLKTLLLFLLYSNVANDGASDHVPTDSCQYAGANESPTSEETTTTNDTDLPLFLSVSLRFVLSFPKRWNEWRNLQQQVPYDQLEFTAITNKHIQQYLTSQLNRNVDAVNLRATSSQVSALQGSTVVKERMSGTVVFTNGTQQQVPTATTVNALTLQALEDDALWEFFFRLRGANDPYLSKAQQVTLVDSTFTRSSGDASESGGGERTFSVGVIITLVVIGVVTTSIVGYFVYWWKSKIIWIRSIVVTRKRERKRPIRKPRRSKDHSSKMT